MQELTRNENIVVVSTQQVKYASSQTVARNDDRPMSFARTRSGPYSNRPNTSYRDPTYQDSPVAKYNIQLSRLVGLRRTADVFSTCGQMKQAGVLPNYTTYNLLLQTCEEMALHLEGLAVFEDMIAMGIRPDSTTFTHLLNVSSNVFTHG